MFVNDSNVFDYWSEMQERMYERGNERYISFDKVKNFHEFEELPKEIRSRFVFEDDEDIWVYTQAIFGAKKALEERLVSIGYKHKLALNFEPETARREALKEIIDRIAFDRAEWLDYAKVDGVLIKFFLGEKAKLDY